MKKRSNKAAGNMMKANPGTVKRLLSYMSGYRVQYTTVVICIIIGSVVGAISSIFLQILIDDYITPLLLQSNPDFAPMLKLMILMGGVYVIGIVSTYMYNRIMAVVSQGTLKKIRDEMFFHMQSLPIEYFDKNTFGDIMSHYTNDTDTLRQMISQAFPQMIASIITIFAVFAAMMYLSIPLTTLVVICLLIIMYTMKVIAGKSGHYFAKQQESLGKINGYIEEMINGQKVVKVFCHEDKSKDGFNVLNEELYNNMTKANTYGNVLMPILGSMGYMLYIVVAIVGGTMALSGMTNFGLAGVEVVTLGTIAAFLQLSRSFVHPISQIAQQVSAVVMALAGASRIFELMDQHSEVDKGTVTLVNAKWENGILTECTEKTGHYAWKNPKADGTTEYTELKGEVRLYDVDFGYSEEKIVLHNITLYAEPGQTVAFVGATGAGKTTITNLINRFYDIADGKIRYDGININKIKKTDLRRSLGMVLQDVNLFTGTVMENLRYGNLTATDEECVAAAKLVNADGFIKMLPEGYDTVLEGDGSGLSQGQRQLISIARAAVADPPVMILDEATSSIDTRTEAIVQKGMDSLMEGRTVFVIAHRLSTVKNADVIMVLEDGRIIERGDHDRLISERGQYYQLYTGAFELE